MEPPAKMALKKLDEVGPSGLIFEVGEDTIRAALKVLYRVQVGAIFASDPVPSDEYMRGYKDCIDALKQAAEES